jgi:hypothetical protein
MSNSIETAEAASQKVTQDDPAGLGEKWKSFLALWLEPFNAALTVLMVAMYILGLLNQAGAASVIAQTVMAITAGILGGRIANAVSTVNSQAVLKARGTVAVRGLALMMRNIRALEKRILHFSKIDHEPGVALAAGKRNYEEVVEMCRVLSEEGVSSIENWTDIVPEARQATMVGEMTALQNAIDVIQSDKAELEGKIAGMAGAHLDTQQALQGELVEKERLIIAMQNELNFMKIQTLKRQEPAAIARPSTLVFKKAWADQLHRAGEKRNESIVSAIVRPNLAQATDAKAAPLDSDVTK